jgi:hypothetical protein
MVNAGAGAGKKFQIPKSQIPKKSQMTKFQITKTLAAGAGIFGVRRWQNVALRARNIAAFDGGI